MLRLVVAFLGCLLLRAVLANPAQDTSAPITLESILAGVVEKSDAEPFTTVSRVSMREKRRAVLSGLRPMKASTLKAEVRTDFAFCYVAVWSFFALQLRYFER